MKAKTINEALSDVLKPKTEDEISRAIPQDKMKFVEDCYELVRSSGKYDIISDLGFMSGMFGFQFETTSPMTKEESIYHTGEIGEFTLGFIAEENDVYIVFDNGGSDYHLEDLEDLKHYLGMEHEGLVESTQDIFKPKSKEEIKDLIPGHRRIWNKMQFEKTYPDFVKIFYDLFPDQEYQLDIGEGWADARVFFTVTNKGKTGKFLLSQSHHHKFPQISFLDTSHADDKISGVFYHNRTVQTVKEIRSYIKDHIS